MKTALALLFSLLIGTANAATIAVTQGSGTNMLVKQDGSSNNAPSTTVCDATNPDNCAPVSATNGLSVALPAVQGTVGAGTAPADGVPALGQYNSTLPTLTTGQTAAVQSDSSGRMVISPTNLSLGQGSTTSGQTGSLIMGAVTTGNPAYTTAQTSPLSLDVYGNLRIGQATSSVAINVSTATTTQLIALSASVPIYVTNFNMIAAGTGNATLEYGTGTNCSTGTTALTGPYPLTAQAGVSAGAGVGPVLVVPAGNALCLLTSAAVQISGSVAYAQP